MRNRPPTTTGPGWPLMERSIISGVLGLPGYAAIGIALGFTGLGVFIDLERVAGLGTVFKGCYFVGCVLAVCWVKRRALFGPLVQPPLLLAVAVPGVVLAAGGAGTNGSTAARLLAIGTPLLNGFPTMAVTSAFVLIVGIGRYRVQRPEVEPERTRAGVTVRPATEETPPPAEPPPEPEQPAERRPARPDPSDEPTSVLPVSTAGTAEPRGPGSAPAKPRRSELHRARQSPPA